MTRRINPTVFATVAVLVLAVVGWALWPFLFAHLPLAVQHRLHGFLSAYGMPAAVVVALVALWRIATEPRRREAREEREEAEVRASLGLSDDPARAWMQARAHIDVGVAEGLFAAMEAANAPDRGEVVAMDLPTACRGTVVFGPQGSGKTSAVMLPFLEQAIAQGWSGLVLAIKENVPRQVLRMAQEHGRDGRVTVIAPLDGCASSNPLDEFGGKLNPESAAAGLADGLGDPRDPYWRNTPQALAQAHLELLKGIGNRRITFPARTVKKKDTGDVVTVAPPRVVDLAYTFDALRETIMLDGADLLTLRAEAAEVLAEIAEDPSQSARADMLEDALTYFARDYAGTFERANNGEQLLAGLRAALLAPLKALTSSREIRRAFGASSDVDIEHELNTGGIVVVYVDDTQYSTAYPAVMRLLFRVFSGIMQRRLANPSKTPCMLWMDEYASFASADHIAPLSRARESEVAWVIGFQSISGLANEMKSKEAAQAIPGAAASLIACGASDPDTAKLLQERVGESTWLEERISEGTSTQQHTMAGVVGGFISSGHRGALGAILSSAAANQQGSSVTKAQERRNENLAAAARLSGLGPTSEGDVRAICVVAQGSEGELRDVMRLPQIPYLRPGLPLPVIPRDLKPRRSQAPDTGRQAVRPS